MPDCCKTPTPPVPLPPLRDEPCSECSPFPHVVPCDFSNTNQKHWELDAAFKDGTRLLWNVEQNAFNRVLAAGDPNPQLVIIPDPIHIDGCGCPTEIRRIEPVGPTICEATDFPFIIPASTICEAEDSDDFALLPFAILPDSTICEVCDKPPVIEEI